MAARKMLRAFCMISTVLIGFAADTYSQNASPSLAVAERRDPQPVFVPGGPPVAGPGAKSEPKVKGDPTSLTRRFGGEKFKDKSKGKEEDDFDTTLGVDQGYVLGHPDIKYIEDNDNDDEDIDFYHSPYHQFLYPEKGVYHQDGKYEKIKDDPSDIPGLKGVDEGYDPSKEPYKTFIYHEPPPYPIPEFPFGGLHVQYQEFIKKNRYKPYYGYKGHLGLNPKEAEHFGKFVDGLFAVGAAMIAMGGVALFLPLTWGPGIFGRTTARAISSVSSLVSNQAASVFPKVKVAFQNQECMERLVCELEARGFVNTVGFFRFVDKFINAAEKESSTTSKKKTEKPKGERAFQRGAPACNRSQCDILNVFFMFQAPFAA